jgi:hypothetical protein
MTIWKPDDPAFGGVLYVKVHISNSSLNFVLRTIILFVCSKNIVWFPVQKLKRCPKTQFGDSEQPFENRIVLNNDYVLCESLIFERFQYLDSHFTIALNIKKSFEIRSFDVQCFKTRQDLNSQTEVLTP